MTSDEKAKAYARMVKEKAKKRLQKRNYFGLAAYIQENYDPIDVCITDLFRHKRSKQLKHNSEIFDEMNNEKTIRDRQA